MKVPFLDLKTQYESLKDEIDVAIRQVIEKTAFAGGPFVAQFEKEFASFCQSDDAIGVGSGTEALWLTLLALGIGPGDEVITTPNTFIATAEAISLCGATPVFVDINEETYNMDPPKLREFLEKDCFIDDKTRKPVHRQTGKQVKAIIPVHLFGQMADMDPIMEIAHAHDLFVVEDACQAHGAEYKGKLAGSIGDAGCFSFYPGKNLGAFGEAGAVVTNNEDLKRKITMLRDHGQQKKYYHAMIGCNSRMDGIQGAVLSEKLKRLTSWNNARRDNAKMYSTLLSDLDEIIIPKEADYNTHVYHLYALRTENRDKLITAMKEKDIYCGIHYPIPVHLQDAYFSLGLKKGSFPVAEKCSDEFVSLPMFPELSKEQIEYVAHEIKHFLNNQ